MPYYRLVMRRMLDLQRRTNWMSPYKSGNVAVDPENIHRLETSIKQASNERDDVSVIMALGTKAELAFAGASYSISQTHRIKRNTPRKTGHSKLYTGGDR